MATYVEQLKTTNPDLYAKLVKATGANPTDWQAQIFTPLDFSKVTVPGARSFVGGTPIWENGKVVGFTASLGEVNGTPITAKYNAQGDVTEYVADQSLRNFVSGNQSYAGRWDATGKPIPVEYKSSSGSVLGGLFGGGWTGLRDLLESGAVIAGNYLLPGSGLLTSQLVSEGAKQQLSSDLGKAGMFGSGLAGGLPDQATINEGWGGAGAVGSGDYGILDGVGGAISSPIASSAGDVIANPLGSMSPLDTTIPGEQFNPDFAKSVSEAPVITEPNTATAAIDTSIDTVPSNPPVENVPPPETGVPTTEAPTTPSTTPTTPATTANVGGNVLPSISTGNALLDKVLTSAAAGTITKAVMPGTTSTTGTSTMGKPPGASDVGTLIGGLLSGASQYSASNTASEANKNAATSAQFRPIGITNTFGTSNFTINPTTGELTSAGVTMTPEMTAIQNALKTASGGSLTDLTNIQNLARGYISKTPEQAAADWIAKQNALLAPSQETETARLLNQLQQGGRTGVSVAQGPGMLSANPEYNALMNARTMAQLKLAADATQQGQNQTLFGVNLLSDAYKPFNTNLASTTAFNTAAMSPMTTSADLAKTAAATNLGAANYLKASQAAAPVANILDTLSKNPLFQSTAGQAFLNSDTGRQLLTYLMGSGGTIPGAGPGTAIDIGAGDGFGPAAAAGASTAIGGAGDTTQTWYD